MAPTGLKARSPCTGYRGWPEEATQVAHHFTSLVSEITPHLCQRGPTHGAVGGVVKVSADALPAEGVSATGCDRIEQDTVEQADEHTLFDTHEQCTHTSTTTTHSIAWTQFASLLA